LFNGFEARELKAMLAKVSKACITLDQHMIVRLDVSGPDQLITLRTEGVVVTVGHGTQPGDSLTVRVYHNRCYPQKHGLAKKLGDVLGVEVDS
jgi:hypothetical protein